MKPQNPLPTYPATQPGQQPVPISPTSQPAAQPATTGPGSRRRPPLSDLGTLGTISMIMEYLLYLAAAVLLVIAGMGVVTGLKGVADSAGEPDRMSAGLDMWGARAHFTWALFEACLAFFLAAVGMGLNHLRYAAAALKSLYLNP